MSRMGQKLRKNNNFLIILRFEVERHHPKLKSINRGRSIYFKVNKKKKKPSITHLSYQNAK